MLQTYFIDRTWLQIRAPVPGIDHAQWPHEAVAFAHHGFEKTRFRGVVAQRRPDFSNDIVDVSFGVDEQIGLPKLGDNLFARDQLFAATDQEDQQLHRFLLDLDATAKAAQFVASEIELDLFRTWFCALHEASMNGIIL